LHQHRNKPCQTRWKHARYPERQLRQASQPHKAKEEIQFGQPAACIERQPSSHIRPCRSNVTNQSLSPSSQGCTWPEERQLHAKEDSIKAHETICPLEGR
jgi:hypothetical protein